MHDPVGLTADRLAGALLAAVGAAAFVAATRYGLGSLSNIGPGALPAAVSAIVFLCGVLLCIGPGKGSETTLPFSLRPMIAVLGGIAAWALLTPRLGLVPGTFALVLLSAAGMERPRWKAAIFTGAALAAFGSLLFTRLLGIPLPILRWF